jgi:hypothetical protein
MVKLDIFQPVIETYPQQTNILSILPKQPFYYKWLYTSYIQLGIFYEKKDYYWLCLFEPLPRLHYPLIHRQFIDKDFINYLSKDIIALFKNALDQGSYIYMFVDTFFIKSYVNTYKKHHFLHDIFIYGYDPMNKEFHIADFFEEGKYSLSIATFDEIYEAFHSSYNNNSLIDGAQLLKVNMKEHYNFDALYVAELLEDYINSINTTKKYRLCRQPNGEHINDFGIKVYSGIINYLKSNNNIECIRKMLHILYEHKKLMRLRVSYLTNENYIKNTGILRDFEKIEKNTLLIRNLYIKSTLQNHEDPNVRNKLVEKLEQVRTEETELIKLLITDIRCTNSQFTESTLVVGADINSNMNETKRDI